MNSTAAARVNGYLSGLASLEDVQEAVDNLRLSAQARDRLLAAIRKQGDRYGVRFLPAARDEAFGFQKREPTGGHIMDNTKIDNISPINHRRKRGAHARAHCDHDGHSSPGPRRRSSPGARRAGLAAPQLPVKPLSKQQEVT